jgi:hypothetical protein
MDLKCATQWGAAEPLRIEGAQAAQIHGLRCFEPQDHRDNGRCAHEHGLTSRPTVDEMIVL